MAGHDGPNAGRGCEQRGGLAGDGGQVGLLGTVYIEGMAQFANLALAQRGDGGGQQSGHLRAQIRRDLRGPGQQVVTGQDGFEVAPAGVYALDSPSGLGGVHDVVVVQGPLVDQLDGHTAPDDVSRGRARLGVQYLGGGHGQGRSYPLAAGIDQVTGDLGQEGLIGFDHGS